MVDFLVVLVEVGFGLGWFFGLLRDGWVGVVVIWLEEWFLCFSSKKADKELTFLFSPLLISGITLLDVIAESIVSVGVIAEGAQLGVQHSEIQVERN